MNSFISMAMIIRAPQIAAPCIAESPTPPHPKTATVDAGVTFAVLIVAPSPVVTPQPIKAIIS